MLMKTRKFPYHALFALLFITALAFAAEDSKQAGYDIKAEADGVTFELTSSTKALTIADTFNLELKAAYPDDCEVVLPKLDVEWSDSDNFGVLETGKLETKLLDDGRKEKSVKYRIEPLVTGEIAPLEIKLEYYKKTKDGDEPEVKEIALDCPVFTVSDVLAADTQDVSINDIKDPVELPASKVWLIWAAFGVFAVIIALLGFVYLSSKKKLEVVPVVQRPAHEIALERLNALLAEKLVEAGKIKEFYEKLSYIIRLYIEHRFDLKAPERTTEEFLQEASASAELPESYKDKLKEFLMHCDMVKFAKYAPTSDEIDKSTDLARNFIEETKQITV